MSYLLRIIVLILIFPLVCLSWCWDLCIERKRPRKFIDWREVGRYLRHGDNPNT